MKKNQRQYKAPKQKKKKHKQPEKQHTKQIPPILTAQEKGRAYLHDLLNVGFVKNPTQRIQKKPLPAMAGPIKPPIDLSIDLSIEPDYDWDAQARESQKLPQGDWQVWLIMAGRGFGKTRTGAETIRRWVFEKHCRRLALVAENELDGRQVMVEGVSGLLAVHPPEDRPTFYPSRGEVLWPNGALATLFSAEAYERLRGPQFDGAWVDELAKFASMEAVWDQLMFGLRLGKNPQTIVTTTPRPVPFLQTLMEAQTTVITRGSSYENAANLAPTFVTQVLDKYKGTKLGAQEIFAEMLSGEEGVLWEDDMIDYDGPLEEAPKKPTGRYQWKNFFVFCMSL